MIPASPAKLLQWYVASSALKQMFTLRLIAFWIFLHTSLQWPELLSRLPVSRLFDVGSQMLNVARFWPAGLTSLVVGTAPTTGAIVGVIAISIFVIVIWLVIYSNVELKLASVVTKVTDSN